MPTRIANLLSALPRPDAGEVFDELLRCGNVRIERIVSSPRPEPVVYDQPGDEWVLLLEGTATLELDSETIVLAAGDHVFIPAHCRHRVLETSAEPRCIWLAVHIAPPPGPATAAHREPGTGDDPPPPDTRAAAQERDGSM
jgi:cupin 2 domain-containing protein